MAESVRNRLGETVILRPYKDVNIRMSPLQICYRRDGAVRRVVVNDKDLPVKRVLAEDCVYGKDDVADICFLVEGRDDDGQVVHGIRSVPNSP